MTGRVKQYSNTIDNDINWQLGFLVSRAMSTEQSAFVDIDIDQQLHFLLDIHDVRDTAGLSIQCVANQFEQLEQLLNF